MNSTDSAGSGLCRVRSSFQTAYTGLRWRQRSKSILPTAKPVVLIPRPFASIGLRSIRSPSTAALHMSTRVGTTSRCCSTIWAGCGNSPSPTSTSGSSWYFGSSFFLSNFVTQIMVPPTPTKLFCSTSFIGGMARDHEGYGKYGDPDLTGTTLTLYGKHHKTVGSKSRSGSPMPSENARSVTSPHDCLPTVKEILTSTYSVSCRMSPNERGQNYTPNCTSCAKRAQAVVT